MTIPRQRFKTIGTSIDKITKPIFGKRGFGQSSVITDWPQIVGATLAQHTVPEKISFPRDERRNATLQLKIDSSALALELQHFSAQLVEKVNTYFGYKAVGKIQIVQDDRDIFFVVSFFHMRGQNSIFHEFYSARNN